MHRPRIAALALTLAALAASCGTPTDVASERVIASPQPEATVEPVETTPPATSTPRRRTPSPSPAPAPAVTAAPDGDLAEASVKLTRLATLSQPLAMAMRAGDDNIYVAEKGGRVRAVRDGRVGATVLDISSQVSRGSEQGLLGLAFSPDGGRLYVNFTNGPGDTIVRSYAFSGGTAQPASARDVLEIDQPFANHNGGNIGFGPDGYLYIGMGDGGSAGDPRNNAQNLNSLLGKMLRIEPRSSGPAAYVSPSGNPFVGRDGRDEIWSYGLRNPWRFSFDRATRDLWIGDVGQNAWEEVNVAAGGSDGGENYGWRRMEGSRSFGGGTPPSNHHAPVYEYANDSANCSVTGGYVYRGSRIPDLAGAYVFADFCAGRLRAFVERGGRATGHRFLGPQVDNLASFGEDRAGELYVLSLSGGFYRIDAG